MKFNERLLKLRKENALSQEELGEKLNVTRQTVSKWELGETTPEMEKLIEMAKLFNVSTDELIKESDDKEDAKYEIKKDKTANGNNKAIIIILVVLLIALLGFLGFKIVSSIGGFFTNTFGMISSIRDIDLNDVENSIKDNVGNIGNIGQKLEDLENLMTQNSKYKNSYTGIVSQTKAINAVKEVIKDNSSSNRKITVSYKEEVITEIQRMTELTKELDKEEYLITLDYDENGYISQLNIADV